MNCLFCGADNPDSADRCINCGKKLIQKEAQVTRETERLEEVSDQIEIESDEEYSPEEQGPPKNLNLMFGGALMIVAGAIGFSIIVLAGGIISLAGIGVPGAFIFFAIGDFFAVISGALALIKGNFTATVILGVFGIGGGLISPLFISSILGLIALALISSSHKDFE